jgi:DNA-binding beta-propeller fold protein YncE
MSPGRRRAARSDGGLGLGRIGAAVTARKEIRLVTVVAAALLAAGGGLAACSRGDGPSAGRAATPAVTPERIIPAPRSLLAASTPEADGTMWAVAGSSSIGLFKFDSGGQQTSSVSVSQAARSVAETAAGVVGVALGSATSGALELLASADTKARRTVALAAPALQVVTAGSDFYVLTSWPSSASVEVVSSRSGKVVSSEPAPKDSVSLAAAPQQDAVYVLQQNGLVDEIGLRGGHLESSFTVGDPGESIAISPDGSRLYVLKGTTSVSNVAVIDTATEGILKVLPAPSHCRELAVSADGKLLYEVVGSAGYGNIQIFGL